MTAINRPDWMVKLDQVETALIGAAKAASLSAEQIFLLGMRWSSYRRALCAEEVEDAARYRAMLCKRLEDAGIDPAPWHETFRSCAVPGN
ncbi:MAG: hypothetical protein F8N36_12065 [Desulfovibrio sp.]|uniref:hypothetical protein n=1 Tax=Desulfovibrio sp. TaxID=885 RepID=UPI00135E8FE0|nr:hypothetical protein [Desulfovibrio sp.]MTJ93583.1 hypothetical protein [Desulfovibrio sp.]